MGPWWWLSVLLLLCSTVQADCARAKAYIAQAPFICSDRQQFKSQVAPELQYKKTLGFKDVFESDDYLPLPVTLVSLFNQKDELVMAQFILPKNNSKNAYKMIRKNLEAQYGMGKRIIGYELSPQFEYRWQLKDGVSIKFKRKKGANKARLTYSLPYKANLFFRKMGYRKGA